MMAPHREDLSGSGRIARHKPDRSLLPACRLVLIIVLAMLVAGCGEAVATPEPISLRATGSTAMSALVDELAEAFAEQSDTVSLEVTGLGTQFGLEALRAGEVDIALASWLPPDLEGLSPPGQSVDARWRALAIARDGIAVIVHPSNPVQGLGLVQLGDLFGGQTHEWRAVGGWRTQGTVQPVSREAGSGTREAFEALVMDGQRVTPVAVVTVSSQDVVEYVAEHPKAIGYVSMGSVSSEVKVLEIEGEVPTPESAGQASYPLTRELWLVTAGSAPQVVQDFLGFVLSPAGQQIVGQRYGRIK